jgi:hypothetical protein
MVAILEIRYLTAPDAYLKVDIPVLGTAGAAGCAAGVTGTGEGAAGGGELRAPPQATANPQRKYQHFFRSGIFMCSR